VIDPKIGHEVPDQHIRPAKAVAKHIQNRANDGKAEVAKEDELLVFALVERAGWVEVVDTPEPAVLLAHALAFWLLFVLVVASNVRQEVLWPANKLLTNEKQDRADRRLLHQLVQLVDSLADVASVCLSRLGHEDHVTLHVTGCLMVLAMRDLPRKVWHEQRRVDNPADGVVECLGS